VVLSSAPADAALVSPNTRLPRSAEVALRRSVPVVNATVGAVQDRLENVLYLLRIPQRKPWGTMSSDVAACRQALVSDRDAILLVVPEAKRQAADSSLAALSARLESVATAVGAQDADAVSQRTSAALGEVATLEMLQAPGLVFLLPQQYAARPRLLGRAEVELRVERRGGGSFTAGRDGSGPQRSGSLRLVLDGYNAPLTAGNFAALVQRGFYDGTPLAAQPADEAVFALPPGPSPLAGAPLPLEMRGVGEFEPRYRAPLDVQSGDPIPVLPLSVYGSAAMARGAEGNNSDGAAFFLYRYSRANAGLGGIAFEEGQYSVFAYVLGTDGQDLLRQLRSGDVITQAKLVAGAENLVLPEVMTPRK
jgi:cyclophilin family peptidyl-prolyl cis-trans isomerase